MAATTAKSEATLPIVHKPDRIALSLPFGATAACGGLSGLVEAMACHPLDTIKVRMQTAKQHTMPYVTLIARSASFSGALRSVYHESPAAFYRGLGAVLFGIIPKMAVRFTSFEFYSSILKGPTEGTLPHGKVFLSGLGAGMTEAVLIVTPTDVLKIRIQTARSKRYGNPAQALVDILRKEGPSALWNGVGLTAARQGTNQAANFLTYQTIRRTLLDLQPQHQQQGLPAWQVALNGFLAGSVGPIINSPIDTLSIVPFHFYKTVLHTPPVALSSQMLILAA